MLAAKDSDWLQGRAEDVLVEYDVETSAYSSLELSLARERYEFDDVTLVLNLLELVPVRENEEKEIVLKATDYYDKGMAPFYAVHAATVETPGFDVLSSESDYEDIEVFGFV